MLENLRLSSRPLSHSLKVFRSGIDNKSLISAIPKAFGTIFDTTQAFWLLLIALFSGLLEPASHAIGDQPTLTRLFLQFRQPLDCQGIPPIFCFDAVSIFINKIYLGSAKDNHGMMQTEGFKEVLG